MGLGIKDNAVFQAPFQTQSFRQIVQNNIKIFQTQIAMNAGTGEILETYPLIFFSIPAIFAFI